MQDNEKIRKTMHKQIFDLEDALYKAFLHEKELNKKNEEIKAQEEELRQSNEKMIALNEHIEKQAEKQKKKDEGIKKTMHKQMLDLEDALYKTFLHEKELNKKNEEIKQKNKDITDSIHYAQRIQEALLTSSEYCSKILPHHFILFKPKDIVSGDFYWACALRKNIAIWVLADCTGHGVPGAFMSMIGTSLLNEIVIEKGITSADKILNEMKSRIIKALGQKGATGETRDGMDAALCIWHKDTDKLEYAGANNSLFIIRKDITKSDIAKSVKVRFHGENIAEIKPDRQPVGYEEGKEGLFTKHEIQLQKGDTLYTFSDGYQDQFGGEKDKKFMVKRFKELLVSIQDKSMQEQKGILDRTIENWKGDGEQIDDICVIGVRI